VKGERRDGEGDQGEEEQGKRKGVLAEKYGWEGERSSPLIQLGSICTKRSLRNFVQMAGAECERNEGPNAGTCPVIKDSARRESFVRQQHHSPPGLTPECRAALSSKADGTSLTFLCLVWKMSYIFFFLFLICFSSKENIFRYFCSKPEDVCVSGGTLGARREADGLT